MKWTLRKKDWLFIAAVIAVVLFVSLLPTPRERNALVPANETHRAIVSEKQCVQCHAAQGEQPLPARHPKRQDCFKCHRRADAS
jgi:hypothetical protein